MMPAHDALALPIYWLGVLVSAVVDWKSWVLAILVVALARGPRALVIGTLAVAALSGGFDILATWPHHNTALFLLTGLAAASLHVGVIVLLLDLWRRLRAFVTRLLS